MRDGGGSDVVGCVGVVTHAVAGGESPGEVRIRLNGGGVESFLAYSAVPLAVGQQVLTVNYRGTRRVDVEPWLLGGDPVSGL